MDGLEIALAVVVVILTGVVAGQQFRLNRLEEQWRHTFTLLDARTWANERSIDRLEMQRNYRNDKQDGPA